MAKTIISLSQYLEVLEQHDWYYSYSSDNRKYQAGREFEKQLLATANSSQPHMALYKAFLAYQFEGGAKPEAPAEIAPKAEEQTPAFNLRNFAKLVSDGQIFGVQFIKRSTGELRTMRARVGVRKALRGGVSAYNAASKNLLTVYDMDAKGYRSIPVENVRTLSVSGQQFHFAG